MLVSTDGGHVDWLVVSFEADVEYHNSTVIETNREQGWEERMEVEAHNTRLSCEVVFWPSWIFDRIATNQTSALLMETIVTITNSKQVSIFWIPLNGGNILLSRFLS